jgi:hypothetical protein
MNEHLFRLDPSVLPDVVARSHRAVGRLTAGTLPIVCQHVPAHVNTTGGGAVMCAEHPAAGIMCPACVVDHTARHPWETEHRCDVCGATAGTMRSVVGTENVSLLAQSTAGRVSLYVGPLLVVALGTCVSCADEAGLPAPEGVVQ